jgi:hypothetical protein
MDLGGAGWQDGDMKTTLGTCGDCGGPVTVPTVWMGIILPTPTCERCGAHPVEAHGPVLPMQPSGARRKNQYNMLTTDRSHS